MYTTYMQTFIADATSIAAMLQTVIALVVIAVFVMAIVSFIMAIRDFITSEGEEEKKKRGWNRIRFMMIGIILTIVFLIIFPLFLRRVWVFNYEAFTAPAIFARVGQLLNYLFSVWWLIQDFAVNQGWFNISPTNTTTPSWYYTL